MRAVIAACIDPRLVEAFAGEEVQTLFDLGLQHLKDNVLVKQLDCDVFVTAYRGFEHQHNLTSLSFGIVIVHVARNKLAFYRPLFRPLRAATAAVRPGQVLHPASVKANHAPCLRLTPRLAALDLRAAFAAL